MSRAASLFAVSFRGSVLPWSISAEDEQRFRRILRITLTIALILALLLPWIPLRKEERTQVQALPPPLAKLLLETKPLPPPTPAPKPETVAQAKPDAAPEAKPKPEPEKPAKRDDRAPVPEARDPKPNRPPGEQLENARRKASGVGLLAMKNELAEMTGAPLAVQLRQDIKPGPGVGTGVGVGVGAGTEAGIPVRSMITSAAGKGSGGINVAAYSRDTGGGGLAGRSTTLVEGVAGGGGGGGYGGGGSRAGGGKGGGGADANAGGTLRKSGSGKASRSIEEIKLVFERHKGAIYALYNRALRDDPSLQGKVVVELTIAPEGSVTNIRLVSSELKAQELEGKLLARIRQFDFGAKDVEAMVVSWPVDFLPS